MSKAKESSDLMREYFMYTIGEIEPYFTAYPYVSTKDRDSSEFNRGEAFFVQYLMKLQPSTRGNYNLDITPPAGARVCSLAITHIGANMPCTEAPGKVITGYENTQILYDEGGSGQERACGKSVDVHFHVGSFGFFPPLNVLRTVCV